jgi:hypothetical protein
MVRMKFAVLIEMGPSIFPRFWRPMRMPVPSPTRRYGGRSEHRIIGASHFTAIIGATIRGFCAGTPICWLTPGVDALVFDTTNAVIYRDTFLELCRVFHELRQEGERTPQIAFMVNTAAGATADKIFHELYEPGLFRELWFQWQGKPLLICDPAAASDTVKNFFTLRRAHWPFDPHFPDDPPHFGMRFAPTP